MSDGHRGFVPIGALRPRPVDPAKVLAEIREIYFKTTRQTIHDDLVHAIELLKTLPDEETRERATVYMEGLTQMRRDWAKARGRKPKR